ncbi:MAG: DUF4349 domain-containing protein [Bacteroidales bacterium]|nr:DUF4349 domain-containing protein [Bacteroidales bacterium]
MHRIIIFCSLFIPVLGCNQFAENVPATELDEAYYFADDAVSATRVMSSQSMAAAPETLPSPPPKPEGLEKKIIRNGNLTIESNDLKRSKTRLDTLVGFHSGYISSESFNDQEDQLSYNITYRIPADKFDQFISVVESGPDKIISKSINANDVTEQYYDVKIRLENERQVEKRYLELLSQARTIKDLLDIEEKLGKIRQEIESKEGRLRYLDDRVNYSTLNIWIYQKKDLKYEPADRDSFGQRLKKSLHKGWQGFVDFILFFLNIWPLWIVGLIIWRLIVWINRRSRKKKNEVKS